MRHLIARPDRPDADGISETGDARFVVTDFGERPFLRWAGGKQRLARQLQEIVGTPSGRKTYHEPFLGAASVFLAVRPRRAVLSDLNDHLIGMYVAVRNNPDEVGKLLAEMAARHSRGEYYRVRDEYNAAAPGPERAAQFIYLNRTGYNGVFRVNKKGVFNVPVGNKSPFTIPSITNLQRVAARLEHCELLVQPFEGVLSRAGRGDIVYLDPPYPPLNGTAYFRHYTPERFDTIQQTRVATVAKALRHRGCSVVISNADTDLIRDLYEGWKLNELTVARWVMSGTRHRVQELIITSDD